MMKPMTYPDEQVANKVILQPCCQQKLPYCPYEILVIELNGKVTSAKAAVQ